MKSVLIIDDDPLIRKTLSSHLAKKGFEVHLAEDRASAMAGFREQRPMLALLDLGLPPDPRGCPEES